jgi:hypothetical protein
MLTYYKMLGLADYAGQEEIDNKQADLSLKLTYTQEFLQLLDKEVNVATIKKIAEEILIHFDKDSKSFPYLCKTANQAFIALKEELIIIQSNIYDDSNVQKVKLTLEAIRKQIPKEEKEIKTAYNVLGKESSRLAYNSKLKLFFNRAQKLEEAETGLDKNNLNQVMEYIGI